MSRSLSVESRSRDAELARDPSLHQSYRTVSSVQPELLQQPGAEDARHRRSASTKGRAKSADVAPKAPTSFVLPPRSYSADDRRAVAVPPPMTGSGGALGFKANEDSGTDGYHTTETLREPTDGLADDSGRADLPNVQDTFRNSEIEAKSIKHDLTGTSEAESSRDASTISKENIRNTSAKSRQKIPPKVPPKPRKLQTTEVKDEQKEAAQFVSIFGLAVPISVHGWMLRVKDEVKIVTATKRLRLDEADEVRIMEATLAERTKERKRNALIAEQEERERKRAKAASLAAEASSFSCSHTSDTMFAQKRQLESDIHTKHFLREAHELWNTTTKDQPSRFEESPQSAPRHRRQASDPVFPAAPRLLKIRDLDSIPANFETLPRFDKFRVTSERAALQPIHLGITVLTQKKSDVSPTQVVGSQPTVLAKKFPQRTETRSVSVGRLSSASTGSLPVMLAASIDTRMEYYARECEILRRKKEKIDRLQREIDRRRQHLAETLRQCERLRSDPHRAAQEPGHVDDDLDHTSTLPVSGAEEIPRRKALIRPIDYPIDPEKYYVKFEPPVRNSASGETPNPERASDLSVYSSFEYLVHKSEHAQQKRRADSAFRGYTSPAWSSLPHSGAPSRRDVDSRTLSSDVAPYSEPEDTYFFYCHDAYGGSSRDSGVGSTVTGTDTLPYRELTPPPAPPERPPPRSVGDRRRATRPDRGPTSYAPASGTPPMPILDDVANRSRNVLRGMRSRPLSDDMGKYFHSEEPLHQMYKEDSEGSAIESLDESTMEGSTAIRRHTDRKQFRAPMTNLHKYPFPTKRILLTSDSKDRTFKGFGINIRGGQVLPWMGDEVGGVYVSYIYPGSSADQLHGELQEGDQILEINGEPIGRKTDSEIEQILARSNCEIELVVKHGVNMRSYPSNTMSTLSTFQTDSNRSSYDNIPTVSSCDGLDSFDGADKESTQLASDVLGSVLDRKVALPNSGVVKPCGEDGDIGDRKTPSALPGNETSVQLTPGNRPHFDTPRCSTSTPNRGNGFLGEIQLQLGYDDYDGTLNVHVIQARYLQPAKFKSGYADPFVKVYLLPYKSRTESKRRAKSVPRTLNPEWHRTLVFLNVPPNELPLKTLDVSVWDHDHLLPDQLMGHVTLDLSDLSVFDNRPHWYRMSDAYGERTTSKGQGHSLVASNGVIPSSESANSSSSSNLSKRSDRNPDRKSPWSNLDRVTPKPSAAPPRPSSNTPDGWMMVERGRTEMEQQRHAGLIRMEGDGICAVNSGGSSAINRNVYLLSKTASGGGDEDALVRRPQQPAIIHQRNSVYPIARKAENTALWKSTDPNIRHTADVRTEQREIKLETRRTKRTTCFDCLLLFFCCSRSRRAVPHTAV